MMSLAGGVVDDEVEECARFGDLVCGPWFCAPEP